MARFSWLNEVFRADVRARQFVRAAQYCEFVYKISARHKSFPAFATSVAAVLFAWRLSG